jgi:hypothetical protein
VLHHLVLVMGHVHAKAGQVLVINPAILHLVEIAHHLDQHVLVAFQVHLAVAVVHHDLAKVHHDSVVGQDQVAVHVSAADHLGLLHFHLAVAEVVHVLEEILLAVDVDENKLRNELTFLCS